MSPSRRFHVLLPTDLDARLRAFARQRGLGLSAAIRHLTVQGLLDEERSKDEIHPNPAVALAALTAAEHAVLMVASVLPEGERRMVSLAERASVAAADRLALFQPSTDDGDERL